MLFEVLNIFYYNFNTIDKNTEDKGEYNNIIRKNLEEYTNPIKKEPFALIGISPFNSYFSTEKILKICEWINSRYNDFAIFIPDEISRYTFEALGYTESRIGRKIKKQDNYTLNKTYTALSYFYNNHPQKKDQIRVHTISQLKHEKSFQDIYHIYSHKFISDKQFRVIHNAENSEKIVNGLRGKHFDAFWQICWEMGCSKCSAFSKSAINKLWETLIPFADYAFNRAHSAGYGLVSYWTAYLKANYPTEYMAALLTSVKDDKDKSAQYLNECRRMGIQVLPPDVNASYSNYTPLGKDIRFGLSAVRNVGENVVAEIVAARENKGRFENFGDFLLKVDASVCNKKTIESLIKAGAFDSLNHPRKGLSLIFLEAIDSIMESKRAEAVGQFDLFASIAQENLSYQFAIEIPEQEWEKSLLLTYEREMLGLYVSDHPLLGIEQQIKAASDVPISAIFEDGVGHEQIITVGGLITQVVRKVSKQGNTWAVVTLEDLEGAIDVNFFSNAYNQSALNLVEDRIVTIRARVDKKDEQPRLSAMELNVLDINQAPTGPLIISVEPARCTPPVVERIKEVLRTHPGKREVHLRIEDGKKSLIMKIDDDLRVTTSPSLSADLKSILGPDCLV